MQRSLETEKIEKQLKVIGILFLALAGFSLLMLLFIPLHFMMMQSFMNLDFPRPQDGFGPDPQKMFQEMQTPMMYMYGLMGVFFFLASGFMLATGINLLRKRHWLFCVIGAALVCPSFPLGTALGVWTLFILFDKQTRPLFVERTALDDADFLD